MKIFRENDYFTIVDTILWDFWDPIGINTISTIRNEYTGYVPIIHRKILEFENENQLAFFLLSIEKERMGLDGNLENCLIVSKKLMKALSNGFN